MKIKKGDEVVIVRGRDRGKRGKVIRVLPTLGRIVVEGANLRKHHVRPKKQGAKGETVMIPDSISASSARLRCPSCSKLTRVGWVVEEGKKVRICKKCRARID